MRVECDIQFASYIYASFLHMMKRLDTEASIRIDCGDNKGGRELLKVKDRICSIATQTADEIRVARSLGRSVLLELQPTPL